MNILINISVKKVQNIKSDMLHLRSLGTMLQRCVTITQYLMA